MNHNQLATGLSLGQHTIEFKQIFGWIAPSTKTVTVYKNLTSQVVAKYKRPWFVSNDAKSELDDQI